MQNYELYRFIDGVWVSAILQMVYFTLWWESGYTRTIDIMLDRSGYYICWGCLCWVPGLYASVSMYIASGTVQLGLLWSVFILAAGVVSCMVNYAADRQKLEVRKSDGKCQVWGGKSEMILAQYKLADGETRTSLLLVSGYWGLARQ